MKAITHAAPVLAGLLATALAAPAAAAPGAGHEPPPAAVKALRQELKKCPFKIVFETRRDGNWELYRMNADGSNPVNLTHTPAVDEVYPKVSPDGARICFCADEGKGDAKRRNLYLMQADGTGRVKISDNAREPCWSADGQSIAYLKAEFDGFDAMDFATKGLFIYDPQTGKHREHPNKEILHLYTLNWSPDGKWFVATVHGGMGFDHAVVAIEAEGNRVVKLKVSGCRPDVSADGKKMIWGNGDHAVGLADLDLAAQNPRASNIRNVVEAEEPIETYHGDFSPDGRYVAFSRGPKATGKRLLGLAAEIPGEEAPGWNICVADVSQPNAWVALTTDGKSNKEADWMPAPAEGPK